MASVTEIALLPLKAGTNPTDPSTPEGQILQDGFATLSAQDGMQKIYFGTEVENPTNLRLFIDWDSHDHHMDFTKTREYQPFLKNLGSIMDGAPALYHVPFEPFPPTTALSDTSAPATEVLTMYFPSDISSADQDAHAANMRKIGDAFKQVAGFKGSSGGWAIEEIPYTKSEVVAAPDSAPETTKAKVYLAVLGWESVDAHMQGRNTQTFKDYSPLLREKGNTLGFKVVHVNAQQIDGGASGGVGADERGEIGGGAADPQEEILNPQRGGPGGPKARADGTTTKNTIPPGNPGNPGP